MDSIEPRGTGAVVSIDDVNASTMVAAGMGGAFINICGVALNIEVENRYSFVRNYILLIFFNKGRMETYQCLKKMIIK